MQLGNLIRKAADFCDVNQPKVEKACVSSVYAVTSRVNRLALKSLTVTHKVLNNVNTRIESRIDPNVDGE